MVHCYWARCNLCFGLLGQTGQGDMDGVNEAALLALMERTGYPMLQVSRVRNILCLSVCLSLSLSLSLSLWTEILFWRRCATSAECFLPKGSGLCSTHADQENFQRNGKFIKYRKEKKWNINLRLLQSHRFQRGNGGVYCPHKQQ